MLANISAGRKISPQSEKHQQFILVFMVSILYFKTIAQYIKLQNSISLILHLNLNKGHDLDPENEFSSKMNTLYIY